MLLFTYKHYYSFSIQIGTSFLESANSWREMEIEWLECEIYYGGGSTLHYITLSCTTVH